MNRRLKYIICVVIILIGLVAFSKPIFNLFVNTDTIANKIGCRLFEFNTITVKSDSDINLNKIEIRTNNRVVYRDNTQQDKIGQFYGHVILEIYYDSLLVSEIGHWKRNNWYTNGYKVILRKHKNHYLVDYEITGPDGKNDNFQKRYVYSHVNQLVRIDYQNENGEVYNSEER